MSMMRENITDELIEEVINEMDLSEEIKHYPDEHVERMHLENDFQTIVSEWLDYGVESMTLDELRYVVKGLEGGKINKIEAEKPEEN